MISLQISHLSGCGGIMAAPVRGCSLQMEIQTYPNNSDTGIYGSNTRIDDHVYQDYTSCTGRYRAYSNNYVLSFALTVEVDATEFET